jgi:hypothetical protein
MSLLLHGEGPGHDEIDGVGGQAHTGLARLKFLGPHRVVDVEQAAEGRRKAGDAGDVRMAVTEQQGRAVCPGPLLVAADPVFEVSPEKGAGVGQVDLIEQIQGDAAPGGLGHFRPIHVEDPVQPVPLIHPEPGPERLRRAVPQAGQVTQALVLKESEQRREAGLVGMSVSHQGQPFHDLSGSH